MSSPLWCAIALCPCCIRYRASMASLAAQPRLALPHTQDGCQSFRIFPCQNALSTRPAELHKRRGMRVTSAAAEPTPASAPVPSPIPASNVTQTPKKREFTLKKGQIVRVDKEKYLNSVEYLSVGHPPYFKGLDYIYEDRGEVLELRYFDHGEYALLTWAGIPTSPAWLPTYMLIKSEKLTYRRT